MLQLYNMSFLIVLQVLGFCSALTESNDDVSRELMDSKKALMSSLGLDHLPRRVRSQNEFVLRQYSAPKFMMGLYHEVSGKACRRGNNSSSRLNATRRTTSLYDLERKYLDESKVDTVISYFNYDHDKSWERDIHKDYKLKFKTKFNPREEIVQGGELKLYKRLPRNHTMTHGNCSVMVYLILPEEKTHQLLETRDVRAWTHGWQTFNVTAALKLWALFPATNHGLRIVVRHERGNLSPRSFGIVGTRGNLGKRPYLVGFVTTTRALPAFTPELVTSRERRSFKEKLRYGNREEECKLKKSYVDFKAIGLHNTIIAPKGYDMHICEGTCLNPMDASLKATNHAALQSMVHLATPSVPNPCCIPGKLKALQLLFFDNDENILLKNHPNMIATSCVCN